MQIKITMNMPPLILISGNVFFEFFANSYQTVK